MRHGGWLMLAAFSGTWQPWLNRLVWLCRPILSCRLPCPPTWVLLSWVICSHFSLRGTQGPQRWKLFFLFFDPWTVKARASYTDSLLRLCLYHFSYKIGTTGLDVRVPSLHLWYTLTCPTLCLGANRLIQWLRDSLFSVLDYDFKCSAIAMLHAKESFGS